MIPSHEVARYLIHLASPGESEDSDCLCHMRLQKLLYYVQGWYLASFSEPLFSGRIEAWKYGPVVKELYPKFADYGYQAIKPGDGADPETLTARQKAFIRSVWDVYKRFSASALRDMTHREAPWLDARSGLPPEAKSDAEITPEAMRAFFREKLISGLRKQDSRIDPAKWEASAKAIAAGQAKTAKDVLLELRSRRARPDQG